MGKREIAILGRVGNAAPAAGVTVSEPRPWTAADEEEENRIMREDD